MISLSACIVPNQGLPNKIKWDKVGLIMCFVQINGEKERGEIVWLYFGDVQFESSNRKKKKKKLIFPRQRFIKLSLMRYQKLAHTSWLIFIQQKYAVYTNEEQFISDTTVYSHSIILFVRGSAKIKSLTLISAQLDYAR